MDAENELRDLWRRILRYKWTDARWHEELHVLTHFLLLHFDTMAEKLVRYDMLYSVSSYSKHTRNAVFHSFHDTKYKDTIKSSPEGKFMRPATAGDAILRLVITATLDAIAEFWQLEWGMTSWFLKGFIRDGALCEAKLARKAAENENLALLFDKMRVSEVINAELMLEELSKRECIRKKASIMECLFANLYEVADEDEKKN